jgi:hypothetical protein
MEFANELHRVQAEVEIQKKNFFLSITTSYDGNRILFNKIKSDTLIFFNPKIKRKTKEAISKKLKTSKFPFVLNIFHKY